MSVYFDASLLVALFVSDVFSDRARAYLVSATPEVVISDFAKAEFASVIARAVRIGRLSNAEAAAAFRNFDTWTEASPIVEIAPEDMRVTEAWLRRLDLNLRAPDALNIAIARRLGASLATFDRRMAESALALGVPVAPA